MTNIGEVMAEANRYFEVTLENDSYTFTSSTKTITGTFDETYLVGQYIRVYNSILNDDVYKIVTVNSGSLVVEEDLIDETVADSSIYIAALAPPNTFLRLVAEIVASIEEDGATDGIASETIDNYSISYKGDGSWVSAFNKKINKWRRARWASNVYSQIL